MRAPAKINLYLHVTGRRDNGYHELDSLIAFADIGDDLRVEPAGDLTLTLEGPFAPALENQADNLVLRAAKALASHAGISAGAALTLTKNLPVASGIGGGSTDAAATLHLLNGFWQAGAGDTTLSRIGETLGADVPVCLFGRTARMQGIGERISTGPELPDCGILLVNPGVAVSTVAVFAGRAGAFSRPADLPSFFASAQALADFLSVCRNDLLVPACRLSPEINIVLGELVGQTDCLFASLSGSGATCFGLFPDIDTARSVADLIRARHPGWWVHAGALLPGTPPPANHC